MNFDTLYVCGCSFTRMPSYTKGDLAHPDISEQWPHLLAQKLNIPDVVNDALWNGSNDRTFRKLDQFLKSYTGDLDKVLFIIQFTFPWRYEMWTDRVWEDYTWDNAPEDTLENWVRLNPGWSDIDKPFDPDGIDNSCAIRWDLTDTKKVEIGYAGRIKAYGRAIDWNEETEYQTTVKQCLAVDNLLKFYDVHRRYMYGDELRGDTEHRIQELIPGFLNNFYLCNSVPDHMKTIDNYHADFQGNEYLANLLAQEILPTITEKIVHNTF